MSVDAFEEAAFPKPCSAPWFLEPRSGKCSRAAELFLAILSGILLRLSYSSCVSYAHLIVSGAYGYPIRAASPPKGPLDKHELSKRDHRSVILTTWGPQVVITSMHLFSSGLTGLILPMRSNMAILAPHCGIHSILQVSGKCPLIIPSADISVTMFYQMIAGSFQHTSLRQAAAASCPMSSGHGHRQGRR